MRRPSVRASDTRRLGPTLGRGSQLAHRRRPGTAKVTVAPWPATEVRGMAHDDKYRILVVDDEPSIVDAVATSLRYEGFDVEEATTGRAAHMASSTANIRAR